MELKKPVSSLLYSTFTTSSTLTLDVAALLLLLLRNWLVQF